MIPRCFSTGLVSTHLHQNSAIFNAVTGHPCIKLSNLLPWTTAKPKLSGAVTRDGIGSGVNRIDSHLSSRAEWFHSAKIEWSDIGLLWLHVTVSPFRCEKQSSVINLLSRNKGLNYTRNEIERVWRFKADFPSVTFSERTENTPST